jgi:hypothetical protein
VREIFTDDRRQFVDRHFGHEIEALKSVAENRFYSVDKDIHWIISQFPRPGPVGYLSAKSLVPPGWSSHLLSVRADRDPSGRQRQETLPARHRYPVSVWCSGQRVPMSASERKANNDS